MRGNGERRKPAGKALLTEENERNEGKTREMVAPT